MRGRLQRVGRVPRLTAGHPVEVETLESPAPTAMAGCPSGTRTAPPKSTGVGPPRGPSVRLLDAAFDSQWRELEAVLTAIPKSPASRTAEEGDWRSRRTASAVRAACGAAPYALSERCGGERLITGQNPQSAKAVGRTLVEAAAHLPH